MSKQELTQWFPCTTTPARKGVYEVDDEDGVEGLWWAYWDGRKFCYRDYVSPQLAFHNRRLSTSCAPRTKWRGLCRRAPWLDFSGNPVHEGDTIQHPTEERGVIEYWPNDSLYDPTVNYSWKVRYGNDPNLSWLGLQIGSKGMAIVVEA